MDHPKSNAASSLAPSSLQPQSNGDLLLNGKPIRILSGALHYFRVPHAYWKHRMSLMVELGLNTVETYVPWNWHELAPELFDFASPERDLV